MAGSMGSFTFDGGGINQMLDRRQNQSQFLRKLLSDEMALAAQSRQADKALQLQRELGLGGLQLDRDRFGLEGELARSSMGLNRDRFGFEQEQGRAATGLAGRKLDLEALAGERQAWRDQEEMKLRAQGLTDARTIANMVDYREGQKFGLMTKAEENAQLRHSDVMKDKSEGRKFEAEEGKLNRATQLEAARIPGQDALNKLAQERQAALDVLRETARLNKDAASHESWLKYDAAQDPIQKAVALQGIITAGLAQGQGTEASNAALRLLTTLTDDAQPFRPSFAPQQPNALRGVYNDANDPLGMAGGYRAGGPAPMPAPQAAAPQPQAQAPQPQTMQAVGGQPQAPREFQQGETFDAGRIKQDAENERLGMIATRLRNEMANPNKPLPDPLDARSWLKIDDVARALYPNQDIGAAVMAARYQLAKAGYVEQRGGVWSPSSNRTLRGAGLAKD